MRTHRAVAAAASFTLLLGAGCARTDSGVRAADSSTSTTAFAPSEPKAATAAYLTKVADTSTAQRPGTYSLTMTISGGGLADGAKVTLTGQDDPASGRSRTTMDLSGLFGAMTQKSLPDATLDPNDPGKAFGQMLEGFFGIFAGPLEVVTDGDSAYVRSEALAKLAGDPSKPWVRLSGGERSGIDDFAMGPNRNTPTSMVEALRGAGVDVTDLGTEQVGGVDTTHYRATIDPAKAAEQLPADKRDEFRKGLQSADAQPIPFDIWVDGQDRVRRIEATFSGGAEPGTATITAEFGGYGEPQQIEIPPADQVQDAPKGVGRFGPN